MLTQFYRTRMATLVLLFTLLFTSCGTVHDQLRVVQEGLPPISQGFLETVSQRTFLQTLTKCVQGNCAGTTILTKGGQYIFGSPLGQTGAYVWGGITKDGKSMFDPCGAGGCGNLSTAEEFSQSVKWFLERGWTKTTSAALPMSIRMWAVMCSTTTYLVLVGGTLTSPIIVPIVPVINSPLYPDMPAGVKQ